jgi:DNA-directed RNA polymerase specialized sigma24 family protein
MYGAWRPFETGSDRARAERFTASYLREYPHVSAFLYRRTGDRSAAEEPAAAGFRIAWDRELAGVETSSGWLFVTARDLSGNHDRATLRLRELHRRITDELDRPYQVPCSSLESTRSWITGNEAGGRVDEREDEILADELAALAAAVGAWGGLTRFVAKLMRKNVHEIDLVVALPFEDAVEHVAHVLDRAGRTVGSGSEPGEDQRTIRVVAGGGAGGMNPVVVTALVTKGGASNSQVRLRAAAKEGLIRPRDG